MSSAISHPINVKSSCTTIKTGWLKWSIKHTWISCSNKKQLLCISRMKVIRNPIQHCFNLWLMETHSWSKKPREIKNLWEFMEFKALKWKEFPPYSFPGMGFLLPTLEACSSGIFQPKHSWVPFLRCEETQEPPSQTYLNGTSVSAMITGDVSADCSSHCSNPELKNTNSIHVPNFVWGIFGNKKHLERVFWFKIDSEISDTSTANLNLCKTPGDIWNVLITAQFNLTR